MIGEIVWVEKGPVHMQPNIFLVIILNHATNMLW